MHIIKTATWIKFWFNLNIESIYSAWIIVTTPIGMNAENNQISNPKNRTFTLLCLQAVHTHILNRL